MTYLSLAWGVVASGKDEMTRRLSNDHVIISSSALIAEHKKSMTPEEAARVEQLQSVGDLYDDDKMIELVEKRLTEIGDVPSVIFNGFPRGLPQLKYFIEQLIETGRYKLGSVMLLGLKLSSATTRFLGRCQEEDRNDSAITTFEKRFREDKTREDAMMRYLIEKGIRVDIIDAEADRPGVEAQARDILARRLYTQV